MVFRLFSLNTAILVNAVSLDMMVPFCFAYPHPGNWGLIFVLRMYGSQEFFGTTLPARSAAAFSSFALSRNSKYLSPFASRSGDSGGVCCEVREGFVVHFGIKYCVPPFLSRFFSSAYMRDCLVLLPPDRPRLPSHFIRGHPVAALIGGDLSRGVLIMLFSDERIDNKALITINPS